MKRVTIIVLAATLQTGCASTQVASVQSFRAARAAGDLDLARTYLTEDPRVWYEKRDGEGLHWTLGAGRYKVWDEHFNSVSDLGPWHVQGLTVWAVTTETNDYYRLIERRGVSRYRVSYFFNDHGRIEGYMISDAAPDHPTPPAPSRADEFAAWAKQDHAQEWEYLRPGDRLDPTGDRAQRTRAQANLWRIEVGLPPIE